MKYLSTIFLIFLITSQARAIDVCKPFIAKMPIQQNGRVKPIFVHSSETIKYLTGKSKNNNMNAVENFCLLSIKSIGMSKSFDIDARIDHVQIMKLLNLKDNMHNIPYSILTPLQDKIRVAIIGQKENNSYKKALNKVYSKINLYNDIIMGENWKLPYWNNESMTWIPFHEFAKEYSTSNANILEKELSNLNQTYLTKVGDSHLLEYKYAKSRLPMISLLLTLIALAALVVRKNVTFGVLSLAVMVIIAQTIFITLRIIISGRSPITNMYETVLFSGYGSLVLAMIIGHLKKEKLFLFIGLSYNLCTLFMLNFSYGLISGSIGPLVPVLRDNFWLSTHVTCIILSYGALALSWVMANTVLIKNKINKITKVEVNYYSEIIYTCLKYGVILLGSGIILGGVWADYSWGRFWGWDPKETWSLIVICIYIAILHGKYTSWISLQRFVPLTALAFLGVMMAWFGVNYILASGLHSYGFQEGGAVFLGSFFAIQFLIVLLTTKKLKLF
ncbi:MAG: cytochrome c biogenesis protein CcsA [Bdellovibrionales bacterium]|nr:cytochrome c biogenesis protein CcsA [Bdellovibrionales bacterium]